jgi:transposase
VNALDEYIVVFGPKPHDRQTRVQPLDGSASGAVHSPVHRSGLRVQRFGITKSAPGDLPETFGPYATCYNRFVRWRRAGVWGRIIDALAAAHDAAVQVIDTSIVRVHGSRDMARLAIKVSAFAVKSDLLPWA